MGIVGEDGKPLPDTTEAADAEAEAKLLREAQISALLPLFEADGPRARAIVEILIDNATSIKPVIDPDGGLPKVVIQAKPDGNLSIDGPPSIRVVLSMLHEAVDNVQAQLAKNLVFAMLRKQGEGIQKPGLADVMALGKRR